MPVINTNIAANSALRYVNINSENPSKFLQQLLSGLWINRSSDDSAALLIATFSNAGSANEVLDSVSGDLIAITTSGAAAGNSQAQSLLRLLQS